MGKRKGADSKGVVAELIKAGSEELIDTIATVFSDILEPNAKSPKDWKQTRLKVLFKKGDSRKAENYRPIAILPILYKLFSKVVCARVKDT